MNIRRVDLEGSQQNMEADVENTIEPPALTKTAEAEIATELKRLYGQMLAEPMPERFAGLLAQLSETERKPERES